MTPIKNSRAAMVLLITALALLTVGTQAGPSIAHGVRHALFAHNADKVDGISSRKLQFPAVVPRGQTLKGTWAVEGYSSPGGFVGAPISFQVPMPATLTHEIRQVGSAPTTGCPGTAAEPTAAPGFLCVYGQNLSANHAIASPITVSRFGSEVAIRNDGSAAVNSLGFGTWAATAPTSTATKQLPPEPLRQVR